MRRSTGGVSSLACTAIACLLGARIAAAAPSIAARVLAHGENEHSVNVGSNDDLLIVDGDGTTDLDCWVYDARGRLVDSDTDETDYCVLSTPGIGRHRLVIKNYGNAHNDYVVKQR
jgi:hypothetical protein